MWQIGGHEVIRDFLKGDGWEEFFYDQKRSVDHLIDHFLKRFDKYIFSQIISDTISKIIWNIIP